MGVRNSTRVRGLMVSEDRNSIYRKYVCNPVYPGLPNN